MFQLSSANSTDSLKYSKNLDGILLIFHSLCGVENDFKCVKLNETCIFYKITPEQISTGTLNLVFNLTFKNLKMHTPAAW